MTGETGAIVDSVPLSRAMLMAGFLAVACYNSVEIFIVTLSTFKRRRGLYFWSLIASTVGIPLHAIASVMRYFAIAPNVPMAVLVDLGWYLMVTGQSFVLYSRLHLVMGDIRKLRWVLAMIITTFTVMQLPTSALFLASNIQPSHPVLLSTFQIFEHVQLACFAVQETILSGLYVWEASKLLNRLKITKGVRVHTVFRELVVLFVVVVALDITLMSTEYAGFFDIETTYKPVVYGIKLKVEMLVLNHLVTLVRSGTCSCQDFATDEYTLGTNAQSMLQSTDQPPLQMVHSASGQDVIYQGRPRKPSRQTSSQLSATILTRPESIFQGRARKTGKHARSMSFS